MHKESNVKRCVKVLRKSVMGQAEKQKLASEIKILQKLVSLPHQLTSFVRTIRTQCNYTNTLRMNVASIWLSRLLKEATYSKKCKERASSLRETLPYS